MFCIVDLRGLQNNTNNDTNEEAFYQFFSNIEETNNFTGFFGIGLREMIDEEFLIYCSLNSSNDTNSDTEIQPLVNDNINFTSNFALRVFTGNCLYYDNVNGNWISDGVEMLGDSNHLYTHW